MSSQKTAFIYSFILYHLFLSPTLYSFLKLLCSKTGIKREIVNDGAVTVLSSKDYSE